MIKLYVLLENLFNGNMLYAWIAFIGIIAIIIVLISILIGKIRGN